MVSFIDHAIDRLGISVTVKRLDNALYDPHSDEIDFQNSSYTEYSEKILPNTRLPLTIDHVPEGLKGIREEMTALVKSNSNIQAKDYVVVTENSNDYWYRVDRVTKNQYANTVVKRISMFHEIGAVPGVQD